MAEVKCILLNLRNDVLYFKDVESMQLPKLLGWYNNLDSFRFATGVNSKISMDVLEDMLDKTAKCSRNFFKGINLTVSGEMIGIVKGQYSDDGNSVWINMMIIDLKYQRKGYGRKSMEMLAEYFKKNCGIKALYLAVAEDNAAGRAFWQKLNFTEVYRVKNYFNSGGLPQSVIILNKLI